MGYSPGGGGGSIPPATTVTGPDIFGAAAAVGTGTNYARSDHDHGLPANPVTSAASLAAIKASFTAANQIIKGTGNGTGELIDFDTTLNFQFGAKGQLFVGTGSGSGAKLDVGANGTVLTADSTQADGVKWAAASGGGLLAAIQYAPSSTTLITITSTAAIVVVDAVNLTIPFVVPTSGNVFVTATMPVQTGTGYYSYLGLMDHSTGLQVGDSQIIGPNQWVTPVTCSWLITGLTPGASLQYDLGAINPGGAPAPLYFAFQGAQGIPGTANRGIGTIKVEAA